MGRLNKLRKSILKEGEERAAIETLKGGGK